MGRDTAEPRAFGSTGALKLLEHLGAVHLVPQDGATFVLPEARRTGGKVAHQGCGDPLYRAGKARELPSSALVDPDFVARGLPTLSLAVESCRLERLFAHPRGRGREWEEPGFVTYFDGGEEVWESPVGVRIHGGQSRAAYRKSFRLYLRDVYGSRAVPDGVVSTGDPPPERLVVHRDLRQDADKNVWHFINPISYEVAARIGCLTVPTRPVMLFLNGEPQHVYVLSERLDDAFFERLLGHGDVDFVRGSLSPEEGRWWEELTSWAREVPRMTFDEARRRVDVENLSRWYASVLFLGTGDAFQSPMARDRRQPGARWFWINWDMDMGLRRVGPRPRYSWQRDLFLTSAGGAHHPARTILFRLQEESPEYRRYLADLLAEALDHRLTPEFLDGLVDRYEAVAEAYDVPEREFLAELREFFRHRPEVVRRQVEEHLRRSKPAR